MAIFIYDLISDSEDAQLQVESWSWNCRDVSVSLGGVSETRLVGQLSLSGKGDKSSLVYMEVRA